VVRTLGLTWSFWILVGTLAGCGSGPPAAGPDYVRSAAGGYVLADPPPGMTVRLGSKPLLNKADAVPAGDRGSADLAR
jgi:hypothetical protein